MAADLASAGGAPHPVTPERVQLPVMGSSTEAVEAGSELAAATEALRRRDYEAVAQHCLAALGTDPANGQAWHVLAIAHEARKDFKTATSCYEAALSLLPGNPRVILNLSRLALTMGMNAVAEQLIRTLLKSDPDNAEGVNNLALALRAQGRNEEAIELLKQLLSRQPGHPNLLNTLGSLAADSGDLETANLLFTEAIRLAPEMTAPAYNLGDNLLVMGRSAEALEQIQAALDAGPPPEDRPTMVFSRALARLSTGDLTAGWEDYESRNDPLWPGFVLNLRDEPRWMPGEPLSGRRLLVIGEQGLGDEVLFAGIIPDLLQALGPGGGLTLAVEPRLVSLMARSFPEVRVEPHNAGEIGGHRVRSVPGLRQGDCDLWTPIASLLQVFRPGIDAFKGRGAYLRADAARTGHWRDVLAKGPPGPKVGLLWKSAVRSAGRHRVFADFAAWAPVLRTPGVVFVNLQYGDCEAELELARSQLGVEILRPPGIDLMHDLDDVTALACALDLTVGFSNATFNLAAAAGAPAWLIAARGAWTTLGSGAYPWYPQVRLHQTEAYGEWAPTLGQVAADLSVAFGGQR